MTQPQLSVRERAREIFEKDFDYPNWWNINGGWEEDVNGLHFWRFIDQIITLAQEEKIKEVEKQKSRTSDVMVTECINDIIEILKK